MHDNRFSKAVLSIILVVVIIGLAASFLEKAPPTKQKPPSASTTNSVIHLIPINTVLTPVGKLEYAAKHSMMEWLATNLIPTR
jgi:hypothetical protein